jgi:hypothetical protein
MPVIQNSLSHATSRGSAKYNPGPGRNLLVQVIAWVAYSVVQPCNAVVILGPTPLFPFSRVLPEDGEDAVVLVVGWVSW